MRQYIKSLGFSSNYYFNKDEIIELTGKVYELIKRYKDDDLDGKWVDNHFKIEVLDGEYDYDDNDDEILLLTLNIYYVS